MADKKLKNSIDAMRNDIQELTEAVWALRDHAATDIAFAEAQQSRRQKQSGATLALQARLAEGEERGYVSTYGSFSPNGDRTGAISWSLDEAPLSRAIDLDVERGAAVLAAIGHPQRMQLLVALLHQAMTAQEVVQALDLATTGAAYHHLNVLQKAGLVEQQHRGRFSMVPQETPALVMILSALGGNAHITIDAREPDVIEEAPGGKRGKKKAA